MSNSSLGFKSSKCSWQHERMNLIALAVSMLRTAFPFTCKDKISSSLKIIWSVSGLALGLSSYWDMV